MSWRALSIGASLLLLAGTSMSLRSSPPRRAARGMRAGPRCFASPEEDDEELFAAGSGRPKINWYPGHIAKAERQLIDFLNCVDVVIEVRDARIPISTTHPLVPGWVGSRPHLVVFNREDCVPQPSLNEWRKYFVDEAKARDTFIPFFSFNAKSASAHDLKRSCMRLGEHVNERRERKGLLPRPVRVAVIGYPNVGKSALINRLVGRRMAKSADKPGVTRSLQWIRIGKDKGGGELELLDSPGIIPAKAVSQDAAEALAMCNDIGSASYDPEHVAMALLERIVKVYHETDGRYVDRKAVDGRFDGFSPFEHIGADGSNTDGYLRDLADLRHRGDAYGAATRILNDFRKGYFGKAALEAPPRPKREKAPKEERRMRSDKQGDLDFDLSTFGVGDFEGW